MAVPIQAIRDPRPTGRDGGPCISQKLFTPLNFYTGRLNSLFFSGLNNPKSQNLFEGVRKLIGEVPYLNGGLFEETELDAGAAKGDFAVPDDIVALLLGDGQELGLFNRYNFTVTEATPFDTEVAVDPEMLGKLFEETVNERHSKGAYYTPRLVVAFMCKEAIKGYLASRDIAGLTDDKIVDLVDNADPAAITVPQALETANAIASLKAVDPACGSGAFLLGMLHEIMALNETLFRAGHTSASHYRQKLDIISNNIYGVDKDGLAVSTAMLRLWLSLAVDYDGDGPPEPLPNLDLKLAVGDAVAGPNPQQLDLTIESIVTSSLQQDIADYTTAQGKRKAMLKGKVDVTKAQLRSSLQGTAPAGTVEWRIDFADVMLNGGFDVVISNPPYVRYQMIGTTLPVLKNQYKGNAAGNSDLYCYFYIRGLQLLKSGGVHIFVCSNSWLDVAYGIVLQNFLAQNAHVQAIYQSTVERQFSTALVNTLISVVRKCLPEPHQVTKFISFLHDFEQSITEPRNRREIHLSKQELQDLSQGNRFQGYKWGAKQLRVPKILQSILNKARTHLVKVGDLATIKLGITTGANEFFYLTDDKVRKFDIEAQFLRPVLTSPREFAHTERSITLSPSDLVNKVFICHDKLQNLVGTAAHDYIVWGQAQGYNQRPYCASRPVWHDLGRTVKVPLAMNELIDTTGHVFHANGEILFDKNFITIRPIENDILPLCVAMNSTLFQLALHSSARENLGGGLFELLHMNWLTYWSSVLILLTRLTGRFLIPLGGMSITCLKSDGS